MNDDCSNEGDGGIQHQTWGPSHSEDATEDFTTTSSHFFGNGDKNATRWTLFIQDSLDFFRCGTSDPPIDEEEDLDLAEEEGGCHPALFRTKIPTYAQDCKTCLSLSTRSEEETTIRESLPSVLGMKPTDRAWSSPPRLRHAVCRQDNAFECGPGRITRMIDDAFSFTEMDTFLSDEFTEMEQGYFNGLYDHICKPVSSRRKGASSVCSAIGKEQSNEVLLSFDDTISKLTVEDGQKSISTVSLNTLENIKKNTVDRATVAAIVKAQAMGGWKARAQAEAEAKAEELSRLEDLSRFGIEHTFTDSGYHRTEIPSDNTIVLHHYPDSKDQDEESERPFDEVSSNFVPDDTIQAEEKTPSRRGFLKAFKRKKKKNKRERYKETKGSKQKRSWPMLTPPRKVKNQDQRAASPTSSTSPCSVSGESHGEFALPDIERRSPPTNEDQFGKDVSSKKRNDSNPEFNEVFTFDDISSASKSERKTPPTVIEEVEVLAKRKEPVYSSYVQTQSYKFVEDVEVLRKESIGSELGGDFMKLISSSHDKDNGTHDVLETVTEELEPLAIRKRVKEVDQKEPTARSRGLVDLDDDEFTSCSSLSPPCLTTMTSRLAKECEETEQLRRVLQEKDEDLELIKKLLRENESDVVMERVISSSKAIPVQ